LRVCATAPKPAFKPLVEKKEAPINENYAEIRVSKEKGEKVDVGMFVYFSKLFYMEFLYKKNNQITYIFIVVEKPVPPSKNIPKELIPQNLVDLETYCGETAAKAIAAYHKAVCALQEYNKDVVKVIESAEATASGAVWQR
jgi:hypothetical protein